VATATDAGLGGALEAEEAGVRVAVLGTGDGGRHLAARTSEVGHDVVIGTRDIGATRTRPAGDHASFDGWLDAHRGIELGTYADAVVGANLVVNATAGVASLDVLDAVGPERLDGAVLADVSNPLDFSAGFPPRLSVSGDDSLAEQLQRAAPGARVVKTLNTVAHTVMVDPGRLDGPHQVFVAGDDAAAKRHVTGWLVDLGWPGDAVVDLGGLRAARALEGYLPLWVSLMQHLGTTDFNLHVVRRDG
jgi:8-hydroxy-5-deazaflavin:NADPH oxidoreductase